MQAGILFGHFHPQISHLISCPYPAARVNRLIKTDAGKVCAIQADFEGQPGIHIENGIAVGADYRLPGQRIDHDVGLQLTGQWIGGLRRQEHLHFKILVLVDACA